MNIIETQAETISAKVHAKIKGFTLLEIFVASAICIIITVPTFMGYKHFVTKARRLEANHVLLNLLSQAEQYYLQNNKYPEKLSELAIPTSQYYSYDSKTCGAGCMEISATAVPGIFQAAEGECNVLTVNTHGDKKPANTRCWKR